MYVCRVDRRLRQATAKLDEPLDGISVIFFGDFAHPKLPPVGDLPLYAAPSKSALSIHGYTIYHTFSTVIILDQVLRQAGTNSSTCAFWELFLCLRDGNVTHEDVHLFYDKLTVEFNYDRLSEVGTPIAAINSSPVVAATSAEDAGGLFPVEFLAKDACVMLTASLWPDVGLCNGARGIVYELLYQEEHAPPNLPLAVLIQFDDYSEPPFLGNCVPIVPITYEWISGKHQLSRQRLPLQLCYAITIHKSQGQTLTKAVIDLGKAKLVAGCTFVAISRLKRLEDDLFYPMTYERLQAIGCTKTARQSKQCHSKTCNCTFITITVTTMSQQT